MENVFQRFYGFYQSTVTNCADPQAQSRAKIKPDGIGYSEEFDFADAYSPFASDDAGFFFPPYEEDQVYVTFDHGDVSSPMIVGSWWKTRGEKGTTDTGLPAEFVVTETDDEGNEVGAAPTIRGIKVKVGSALVFDETEDDVSVELWSGESQGIGKRATKLHRLRLDSTTDAGQVVLATYGDENSNAETISDEDSTSERERKELEGRLRHQILMRDTSDDRFVWVKTVGEDDEKKFLQILMSDTDKKILVQSSNEHFFEIDDENDKSEWKLKDGFRWLIDQKNKKMLGETTDGRRITLDDDGKKLTLETPLNQTFEFSDSETKLEDTGHDINVTGGKNINVESTTDTKITATGAFNVDATGASTHSYKATLLHDITGSWTAKAASAIMQITGSLLMQASQVTIASATVLAGTGTNLPLVNTQGLIKFNTHTHIVVGLLPGFALPTTNPMIPGTDSTVALLGA